MRKFTAKKLMAAMEAASVDLAMQAWNDNEALARYRKFVTVVDTVRADGNITAVLARAIGERL